MPLYGPKWPLKKGNHDTYELYEDVDNQVKYYLKNLILTSPGENISDPAYGVGLRRFLFENNIESVRELIRSEISSQINQYLPYLSVSEIDIVINAEDIDNNLLNIRIVYTSPNSTASEIFNLEAGEKQSIGFY